MVVSSGSTFGCAAYAWASLRPFVVIGADQCMQDVNTEPIMHQWKDLVSAPCVAGSDSVSATIPHLQDSHVLNHLKRWSLG